MNDKKSGSKKKFTPENKQIIGARIKELRKEALSKPLEECGIRLYLILDKIKSGVILTKEDYSSIIETAENITEKITKVRSEKRKGNKEKSKDIGNCDYYRVFMHKLEGGLACINEQTALALAYYFSMELLMIPEEDLPHNITICNKSIITNNSFLEYQMVDPKYFLLMTDYINDFSKQKYETFVRNNIMDASYELERSLINLFKLSGYKFDIAPFKLDYPLFGPESISSLNYYKELNKNFIKPDYITIDYDNKSHETLKNELEMLFNEVAEYALFKMQKMINEKEKEEMSNAKTSNDV